jgi:hypothetical protein
MPLFVDVPEGGISQCVYSSGIPESGFEWAEICSEGHEDLVEKLIKN